MPRASLIAIQVAVLCSAALVVALELTQPLTAAGFMTTLRVVDRPVVFFMSPFVIAATITAWGSARAVRGMALGQTGKAWLFILIAFGIAPLIGWGGHALAVDLLVPRF
jgi:hypothetical protein